MDIKDGVIRKIYDSLGDDESKHNFTDRLLYNLTEDRYYLNRMVKRTNIYARIKKSFECESRPKYIFGIGLYGKALAELFGEFGIEGIVDNHVKGVFDGIPVISFQEYAGKGQGACIYISSPKYCWEMEKQLSEAGVRKENIVNVGKMILDEWNQNQYFDLPYLQKEEQEVFVDGGCLDGATAKAFAKWAGRVGKCVYAFEPDARNIEKCRQEFLKMPNVKCRLISKGLWSEEGELRFAQRENNGEACLCPDGDVLVPVTSIDKCIKDTVTFLKLDVEGSEAEALKGSRETIQRCRTKLAVCVYHKPEDIWEIPELILSMNREYKLYVRHYSVADLETVLYAVCV